MGLARKVICWALGTTVCLFVHFSFYQTGAFEPQAQDRNLQDCLLKGASDPTPGSSTPGWEPKSKMNSKQRSTPKKTQPAKNGGISRRTGNMRDKPAIFVIKQQKRTQTNKQTKYVLKPSKSQPPKQNSRKKKKKSKQLNQKHKTQHKTN